MELENSRETLKQKEHLWEYERNNVHCTVQQDPAVDSRMKTQGKLTPLHGVTSTEVKLRDTLGKKEQLVLALRDVIKKLGAILNGHKVA